MKKRRSLLLLLLFLTGLLLSMTTYAWFSTNRIFEIESFDIQVASKGGIEVSLDATNWKGVVGMLDMIEAVRTYPGNVNQVPNNVKPVSTVGDVEAGKMKMFYGEVEMGEEYFLHASRSIETAALMEDSDGVFVAFDIFLRSQSPRLITIGPGSGVSYKDGLDPSGIENAFRLGFINQGTAAIDATALEAQRLNRGTSSLIWEVNYDSHVPSAVLHAQQTYGLTTQTNGAARLPYHGIRADIPRDLLMDVGLANGNAFPAYLREVRPQIMTTKQNNTYQNLLDIAAGITKIRVYVWLEGQDVDCEDNASFGDLSISLQFVAQ